MKVHNIRAALAGIRASQVKTAEDDAAAFPRLSSFDSGAVYVGRFSGQSPWERHPDGDELLHILNGDVEITLMTEAGTVQEIMGEGEIFVVPKGVWHRQLGRPSVTLLAVTPDKSDTSFADDPSLS